MIRVEGVKKVFNAHSRNANQVLKGVSFELPDKGLVAIFGKSGSGKTTLLNIMGGLDKQDAGKVYIGNEDMSGKADRIRNAKIGYIFQNYYLENGYTIVEILEHAMLIAGFKDQKEIDSRIDKVLKLVNMDRYKNKKSDALSGGQKQRVAIARALIKGSDVILADEPTGNLDAENTVIVMDILKKISKNQLVVLVTHEVNLIHNYADSHIKIVDGELKDNEELEHGIEYEINKNNILVDKDNVHNYNVGKTNIKIYGDEVESDDIEIFTDKGNVYIRPGKNVTVLDENSEKKIIFGNDKKDSDKEEDSGAVPEFEKSSAKRNGRLFTFKSIFRARKKEGESIHSIGNTFKRIFICAIAIVMCFFSLTIFEISRLNIENKEIDKNQMYFELNAYDDLKALDAEMYERVDFFDTQMKQGDFSYTDIASLTGIKAMYVPRAIEQDMTDESLNILIGKMPKLGEILITRALADTLKNEFRLAELSNDNSLLLVVFNGEFEVSGIVEGDKPYIYMNKQDYVNFLGVYNEVVFLDFEKLFFEDDYSGVSFTSQIVVDDGSRKLTARETNIEINRNSLYKMMPNVVDADYKVKYANAALRTTEGATSLEIKDSNLYVRKLEITREAMSTDIRIYVSPEAMDNIFVYLEPNVNALKGSVSKNGIESKFYFEVVTKGEEQMEKLTSRFNERGINLVDVESQYQTENEQVMEKQKSNLNIFFVVMILLMLIYYFVEKSGSLKNSKEYGIYRAIGVNKSNLLYKETVLTIFENIIIYFVCFVIVTALMCTRYFMMNIAFVSFIGIAFSLFVISSVLMLLISLIPYLFVLVKTPAGILARYDI